MTEKLTNFAQTHMNGGIDDDDIVITVNDGSNFPTDSFYIVIDSGTSDAEIVWVATRSGNTLNINSAGDRGLQGTTAVAHDHGSHVGHTILAHHVADLAAATRLYSLYLYENFI